ncbi:unnamed protein product [Ceutorhynchus assimilis]|uniref:THD domain-containing protein n=1 Tax=Ceutorhynchus assimilis TaxID=467358 RepID=A0A9N9MD75_9CUCU|nr:unnamed protein product [Ceutorhynchus assimilis]
MIERQKEMQKNAFSVAHIACFLLLASVSFFNMYRVFLLENQMQDVRDNLDKCESTNLQKYLEKYDTIYNNELHQTETRNRRSIRNNDPDKTADQSTDDAFTVTKQSVSELPASIESNRSNQKGAGTPKQFLNNYRTNSKLMRWNDVTGSQYIAKSLDSNEFNSRSSEIEFPLVRDEDVVTRRTRNRMQNLDERHPRTGRIKPLPSIHLSGDTSKYILGTHHNFRGNGHLRHLQNIFVDWKANGWVEKTGMMSHFILEDGYLTIRESGLYLVYAQIYYLDEHDINGYRVYKNDDSILQCTISLHSGTRSQKGNTCYTAGVEHISEGDKISLGDILDGHYSLFEPGKSFFGAVKLGDIRTRP